MLFFLDRLALHKYIGYINNFLRSISFKLITLKWTRPVFFSLRTSVIKGKCQFHYSSKRGWWYVTAATSNRKYEGEEKASKISLELIWLSGIIVRRGKTERLFISSLCYHYGISQTYAKMHLVYCCKHENEVDLTKLSD